MVLTIRILPAVSLAFLACGTSPPPPPMTNACPAGATLRATLWDVYATPRRPDGDVWDGVGGGTIELVCNRTADVFRQGLTSAITNQSPLAGQLFDQFVSQQFQQTVADVCGVSANWFQQRYEGPDLFARGGFPGESAWRWQTITVQDRWTARLNTTTDGASASWDVPCGSSGAVAALAVTDSDLAFDDPVGQVQLDLSSIPPASICDGWALYEGNDGIAWVVLRLQVAGAGQQCP